MNTPVDQNFMSKSKTVPPESKTEMKQQQIDNLTEVTSVSEFLPTSPRDMVPPPPDFADIGLPPSYPVLAKGPLLSAEEEELRKQEEELKALEEEEREITKRETLRMAAKLRELERQEQELLDEIKRMKSTEEVEDLSLEEEQEEEILRLSEEKKLKEERRRLELEESLIREEEQLIKKITKTSLLPSFTKDSESLEDEFFTSTED